MFRRYPLLFVLLALTAGILVSGFFYLTLILLLIGLGICAALIIMLMLKKVVRTPLSFAVLFFLLGLVFTGFQDKRFLSSHYQNFTLQKDDILTGQILANSVPTRNAVRLEVELTGVQSRNDDKAISGKVFLYIPQKKTNYDFKPGDKIVFQAQFNPIEPPKNPYEFDYKNYLNLNQVYAQAYTDKIFYAGSYDSSIWRYAAELQHKLRSYISQLSLDPEKEAVAQALLLGYKYLLTDDTARAFAGAGAMHVLAVSGLHVGILYMILAWILRIDKRKLHRNNLWQVILTVVIIWAYAFVTGLSPSVARAATMFSFIAFGHLQKRKPAAYQGLLASALLLLAYKPNYLFEVGFQLSYAAVFGILYIQPKIYHLIEKPRWWLTDQIWQITAVSIAAQLATFPLSLYYFHQFPVLFLISNLIVIPLAWLIMVYGLSLLTISIFLAPGFWLIEPFRWLTWLMTNSVRFVEEIPYAVLHKLWIGRFELVVIMVLVFACVEAIFYKKKRALILSMACAVILLSTDVWDEFSQKRSRSTTLYAVKNMPAIEIRSGKKAVIVAPQQLLTNEDAMLFHIRHNQWAQGIQNLKETPLDVPLQSPDIALYKNWLWLNGETFLFYQHAGDSLHLTLQPDYILVYAWVNPPQQKINGRIVLLEGLTEKHQIAWHEGQDIFHDLGKQGALILKD